MAGWMKKLYNSEGLTEYPVGPMFEQLRAKFQKGGTVVLAIDVSYSMKADLPEAVKGGLNFIDEARSGGYKVGIIIWSHELVDSTPPDENPRAAQKLLENAKVQGATNVLPALKLAYDYLRDIPDEDRVIAIFGDGDLGTEAQESVWFANTIKAEGIRILTIGIGGDSARKLAQLASEDGEQSAPRETNSTSLAKDMRSLATGIISRRRK